MEMFSDTWLARWLLFVAVFRLLSTYWGYFNPAVIANRVFDITTPAIPPTTARFFGAWTLLSFAICVATAFDLRNKTLFLLCLSSFIVAFAVLGAEYWVYKTMSITGFRFPCIISGTTIIWMTLFAVGERFE